MKNNIPNNIFEKLCLLNQKVQTIENQVKEEVSHETRVLLHRELESLQGSLETLRQRALQAQKQAKQFFLQFEEMENQIISLYRKVEERFEEFEISLISKEAIDLSQSLTKGKMVEVAKKVHELRHNVLFLFKHRRPSMQHRKIVHFALKLTDCADEILAVPGELSKKQLQMIQLLKTLLMEAINRADNDPCEEYDDGELAMELYEIADLFHHKKEKEGWVRLNLVYPRLRSSQQIRLSEIEDKKEMVQTLLEIASGDPCTEWEEKKKAVIVELQA